MTAKSSTPEYSKLQGTLDTACSSPKCDKWEEYGSRGIQFKFESFEQFLAEVGPRPAGMTLDRINRNGDYELGNVRWATKSHQNKNRRRWR